MKAFSEEGSSFRQARRQQQCSGFGSRAARLWDRLSLTFRSLNTSGAHASSVSSPCARAAHRYQSSLSSSCESYGRSQRSYRQSLSLLDAQSLSKRLLVAVRYLYEEIKLHQAIPSGLPGRTGPGEGARPDFTLGWSFPAGNLEPRISRPRHRHGRKCNPFAFAA